MSDCRSFAPIIDTASRILILGSMPGQKSLDMQQYYAHPQNRFWNLLALLLNAEIPATYSDKIALLRNNRIALWDVLGFCEREGSLDSDIKNEQPNDILRLLRLYPQLQAIFCNGGKAKSAFKKYFAREISIPVYYLSSTSPANARMNLAALAQNWAEMQKYLQR